MIGLLMVGFVAALFLLGCMVIDALRNHTRKVRRRDYESAMRAVNDIDLIVSRYYLTADVVGQAMCDEIRTIIAQHRKDTTCL